MQELVQDAHHKQPIVDLMASVFPFFFRSGYGTPLLY